MISSAVGAEKSRSGRNWEESVWKVYLEFSSSEAGRIAAASGFDVYRSSKSILPKEMTGVVAYTGIRLNNGMCLQQCAYAPR